jgi:hypothetical protein
MESTHDPAPTRLDGTIAGLLRVAVRNGASFHDASAFVTWTQETWTDAEIAERSLAVLWCRWSDRAAWDLTCAAAAADAIRWARARRKTR